MALSKPRVYRFHCHSPTHFRFWQRFTGAYDRQKQQLNRGGRFSESFYLSVVKRFYIHFQNTSRHETHSMLD